MECNCGGPIPLSKTYCPRCGKRRAFAWVCVHCGANVPWDRPDYPVCSTTCPRCAIPKYSSATGPETGREQSLETPIAGSTELATQVKAGTAEAPSRDWIGGCFWLACAILPLLFVAYLNVAESSKPQSTHEQTPTTCPICHGNPICKWCSGRGSKPCGKCNAVGNLRFPDLKKRDRKALPGEVGRVDQCQVCGGSGWFECGFCRGTGKCNVCGGAGVISK